MTAHGTRDRRKEDRRPAGEWRRYKLLYACLIASVLLHFFFIFSVGPWWIGKAPRVKPRETRVVSLKIKPRPVPPRPPAKAPALPEPPRPVKEPPPPKPVYTEKQIEEKLAEVRSKEIPRKFAKPKRARMKEAVRKKEVEAEKWTKREADKLEEQIQREAAGEVGYRRVVNLTKSSDYQIGRMMGQFKMGVGYGSRKITDLNLPFTSEWLFTPGQIRGHTSRRDRAHHRKVVDWLRAGKKVVALQESGEGAPRAFIAPSVAAVAAIIVAEEEYFGSSGSDPDDLESLVFEPVWTFKGPAFKVVKVEKKKGARGTPSPKKGAAKKRR